MRQTYKIIKFCRLLSPDGRIPDRSFPLRSLRTPLSEVRTSHQVTYNASNSESPSISEGRVPVKSFSLRSLHTLSEVRMSHQVTYNWINSESLSISDGKVPENKLSGRMLYIGW